ncbi:unnamed protein product [Lathyrus oleraceus]
MANLCCLMLTLVMLFLPVIVLPEGSHTTVFVICILVSIVFFIFVNFCRTFKKVDNFEDTIQIQILQEQREFHANQNAAWSTRVIPNSQMNMAFGTIAEMARWAIRALPPVKVFNGEEAQECPICMEEFEKGILVQSFGVCAHEYHTSCLNSWLLGGKTSCPVCRQDLAGAGPGAGSV